MYIGTHTSSSCSSKYWFTCRAAPNNNHLRNGHYIKLVSGGWSQSGYIEASSVIIVIESERICPTISSGNCDLIARNRRNAPEYRSLPVDPYISGTNIHALNGDIYRLGWWNCMKTTETVEKENQALVCYQMKERLNRNHCICMVQKMVGLQNTK